MSDEFYKVLEISKTASQKEIQSAYRKLARKLHPDLNQSDPNAKQKFQKVQEAYDVLNDPEKRRIYDQFGVSPDQMGSAGGGGPHQWSYGSGGGSNPFRGFKGNFGGGGGAGAGAGNFDLNDILRMFGGGMGGGMGAGMDEMDDVNDPFAGAAGRRQSRGVDIERKLSVPFTTAVLGGTIELKLKRAPGMKDETVAVNIPTGIEEGKKIRLPGFGKPGTGGGKPGNMMLVVHIEEHPCFRRQGQQLYVDVPVSLNEAVFGAKIDVPTPTGNVRVSVPAGSSTGTKLRLRGRGVPASGDRTEAGDLFAELSVRLPKRWSSEDLELLKKLQTEPPEKLRDELRF